MLNVDRANGYSFDIGGIGVVKLHRVIEMVT